MVDVSGLYSDDEGTRVKTVAQVFMSNLPNRVDLLLKALKEDTSPAVRAACVMSLLIISKTEAVPPGPILEALEKDPSAAVQTSLAISLAKSEDFPLMPEIVDLLQKGVIPIK